MFIAESGLLAFCEGVEERCHVLSRNATAIGQGSVVAEDLLGCGFVLAGFLRGGEDNFALERGARVNRGDHFLGRLEIFFQEGGGGKEGVGHVIEALTTGSIGWEIFPGIVGHSKEIAHGVVVFVAVKPAQSGTSGPLGNIA